MRLLHDTNIVVSDLLSPKGPPGKLARAWLDGRYDLVTSEEQLDELRRVLGYEHLRPLINPALARDFVDNVDAIAIVATGLPTLEVSPDPDDNVILATAVAGAAEAVVSGDKSDMLSLGEVEGIPVITAPEAPERLGLEEGR